MNAPIVWIIHPYLRAKSLLYDTEFIMIVRTMSAYYYLGGGGTLIIIFF